MALAQVIQSQSNNVRGRTAQSGHGTDYGLGPHVLALGKDDSRAPVTLHLCAVDKRGFFGWLHALTFELAPDLPSKSSFQILRRPMALTQVIQGESNDVRR